MIESKFDAFVNKILKESLQGGNIASTKVSAYIPQPTQGQQKTGSREITQTTDSRIQAPQPSSNNSQEEVKSIQALIKAEMIFISVMPSLATAHKEVAAALGLKSFK